MARAMQNQAALLLRGLGCHEPHIGSRDRFANCLSIGHIVLLSLDVGLHVGRWHQPHPVTNGLQLARPIMRLGARLDANQAWRKLLEKRYDLATLQLPADNHLASSINAMHLKD